MAGRKVLKGVVNNVVHSFVSLMNYAGDDYVMGHVVFAAWATGETEIRVDLLGGQLCASPLITPEVREGLLWRVADFPSLVERAGSDIAYVASAELQVTVDPTRRRALPGTRFLESPFIAKARITDDLGTVYEYELSGWWSPEQPPDPSLLSDCSKTVH